MLCQIKVIAHQRFARGPGKGRRFQESNPNKLTQRTPGLNTLGFLFAVLKGNMKETVKDNKQKRQVEFMQKHTLTREDLRKMIDEKFARARQYSEALAKREMLVEYR